MCCVCAVYVLCMCYICAVSVLCNVLCLCCVCAVSVLCLCCGSARTLTGVASAPSMFMSPAI